MQFPQLSSADSDKPKGDRRIGGHRTPSPFGIRVVAGTLLIAASAAGTFAVANGTLRNGGHSVVVAAHDIQPGARLEPSDLQVLRMDIDSATARRVASHPSQLDGLTVLGPVGTGELIQASNVIKKASDIEHPEVSFALPASRAVGGSLKVGEEVDVLATDKTTESGAARTAASGALVISVDSASSKMSGAGDLVVTLSVVDAAKAAAIVAAVDNGSVTLVRTTGTGGTR